MQQGFIWGWDTANSRWVRVQADSQGRLIIDPSNLFESTPTDGESKKGPDSDWAYNHQNNTSVHHSKTVASELNHNDLSGVGADDHHTKTPLQDFQGVTDIGEYTYNDFGYKESGAGTCRLNFFHDDGRYRQFRYNWDTEVFEWLDESDQILVLDPDGLNIPSAGGVYKHKGSLGASGSFTTADGKTVTVSGGIITDIS